MINAILKNKNSCNYISFKGLQNTKACDTKTAKIEKKINEVFGVSLDEFIKVCDERRLMNNRYLEEEQHIENLIDSI